MTGKRYQCGVSTTLDSSRWIKLSDGLDDFRHGPPPSSAGRIIPANPGVLVLESADYSSSSSITDYSSTTSPSFGLEVSHSLGLTVKRSMTVLDDKASEHMSSSRLPHSKSKHIMHLPTRKLTTATKAKLKGSTIEQKLKENPLLLLPYLEADIPHEVFVKLMNILGPSHEKDTKDTSESEKPDSKVEEVTKKPDDAKEITRRLYSRGGSAGKRRGQFVDSSPPIVQQAVQHLIDGDLQDQESIQTAITEQLKEIGSSTPRSIQTSMIRQTTVTDPYRSFLKRVNFSTTTTSKKKTKAQTPKVFEEEEDLNPRQLAEDFCGWLSSMGGEERKFNMDADKILTLFAMDADLQPTTILTTSHVLEEFPLSAEERLERLRQSTVSKPPQIAIRPAVEEIKKKEDLGPQKPIRYRYGAWYLDINQWKKLAPGEKLEDPEEIETKKRIEAARNTDQLDSEISNLHGYKALMTYLSKTGQKPPNFLKNVKPPPSPLSKEDLTTKSKTSRRY